MERVGAGEYMAAGYDNREKASSSIIFVVSA